MFEGRRSRALESGRIRAGAKRPLKHVGRGNRLGMAWPAEVLDGWLWFLCQHGQIAFKSFWFAKERPLYVN